MTSDRDALLETLAELAAATDARDWDLVTSLLTDDAVAYGARGPAAVVQRMRDHLGGVGPSQHLLGNHRLRIDGDEAHARTYGRVRHVGAGPLEGSFYECLGDYDDHWVRTSDGWRLARRHFQSHVSLGDMAVLRPA